MTGHNHPAPGDLGGDCVADDTTVPLLAARYYAAMRGWAVSGRRR